MRKIEESIEQASEQIANLENMLVTVQRALEESGCESVAIPKDALELAEQPMAFRCRPRGGIRA